MAEVLATSSAINMSNPFQHIELLDWFFEGKNGATFFPNGVVILGNGPFHEDELYPFLTNLNIPVSSLNSGVDVLVVGREDWDFFLHDAIEARRGQELRVYSQEMFLSYLGCGYDPLENPDIAHIFGDGHPALEFIREWGFDWPTTRLVPSLGGSGVSETSGWKPESFVKLMGYTVGAKGQDPLKRRLALQKAFFGDLPKAADPDYIAEWGPPQSGIRLRKIAERLNINIVLGLSRDNMDLAVRHWLDDMAWLKSTYYDGRYTFAWPSTFIG